MKAEVYGEALYQVLSTDGVFESTIQNLKAILKKNGHRSLYGQILRDVERRFLEQQRMETASVIVSKKEDYQVHKKEITALLAEFAVTEMMLETDEQIVGGFIVRGKGKEYDRSYKKSLLSIYRALTA